MDISHKVYKSMKTGYEDRFFGTVMSQQFPVFGPNSTRIVEIFIVVIVININSVIISMIMSL